MKSYVTVMGSSGLSFLYVSETQSHPVRQRFTGAHYVILHYVVLTEGILATRKNHYDQCFIQINLYIVNPLRKE